MADRPNAKTPLVPKPDDDAKIKRVRGEIHQVQSIMSENIDRAIERGADINDLDDKSLMLEHESRRFKEKSSQVRRNMCMQYYRQILVIAAIIIAIIIIIVIIVKTRK